MPRREQPLGPGDDALLRFARDLRQLRERAGTPTYRELSARAHYSAAALSEAASGRKLPSLAVTSAYVAACDGDRMAWEKRWREVAAEIAATNGAEPADTTDEPAPYVGLAAFQAGDADRFFGRDKLAADLLSRVRERRFLGVFGASGSGKSSLLRAGLVARLPHQSVVLFTPGPHPVEECAIRLATAVRRSPATLRAELAADPRNLHLHIRQAMADRPDDGDLTLVVDQFEEAFTVCDDAERTWLINALTTAASARTSRTRVVLGVRADFYGHCGQYPQLVDALRDAQFLVGPMTADELRQAITQPAERAGCRVETALVSQLISDATGQPGVLPLVSHALLETWRRRHGTMLTLSAYDAIGGIQHALAHSAEAVYTALNPGQQAMARQVFLRLTALGEGTDDTKRRIDRRELDTDNPDTSLVLDRLAAARLITVDRDTVDLAHEALIRHWPRLRDWLADDRAGLRIHRELTEATEIWESLDRDPGALYRGARLAIAADWASTRALALTPRERRFLDTSRYLRVREQLDTQRRTRRLRGLAALLGVLLLIATVAVGIAVRAQQAATAERNSALAQKALRDATAMRAANPALALQLAVAAYRLDPTKAARETLHEMFATPYATRLDDHPSTVFGLAISPDGRLLVTATLGPQQQVGLRDISDPLRPRDLSILPTGATSAAFSPDGRILATTTAGGWTQLWDLSDQQHPHLLSDFGEVGKQLGIGSSVTFNHDGRFLASAGADRAVRLWNVEDRRRPELLVTLPDGPDIGAHRGSGASVALSPDGHRLVATAHDQTARLWDVTDPRRPALLGVLAGHTDSVAAVGFSPDGHVVATTSYDMTIRLWNVADPRDPKPLAQLTGHSGPVLAVAFSRDGTLATASDDRTTRLWKITDPAKPSELIVVTGHTDVVRSVVFSPDGRTLVTGSADRTVRLEDISHLALASHTEAVNTVVYSPKGDIAATSSDDQTVRLWDFTDRVRPNQRATLHVGDVASTLSVSSDGRILAAALADKVELWDVGDPNKPRHLASIDTAELPRVAFSPNGLILAISTTFEQITRLLDVSDPNNPRTLGSFAGDLLALSPDGHVLTTTHVDRELRRWDLADAANPRTSGSVPTEADSVAFSPSGHILAVTRFNDHHVGLWDISRPHLPEALTAIPTGAGGVMAFSPDGRRLVTNGADKTALVWDITDPRRPVEESTLRGHAAEVHAVAFSPDGSTIVTTDEDHVIRLWDTDVERVAARVCEVAWPRITPGEWEQYFPGLEYRAPCP